VTNIIPPWATGWYCKTVLDFGSNQSENISGRIFLVPSQVGFPCKTKGELSMDNISCLNNRRPEWMSKLAFNHIKWRVCAT
jgi:hypothetical protein